MDAIRFAIGIGAISDYACIVYLLIKSIWRAKRSKGDRNG